MARPLAVIVLAAGLGKRTNVSVPKVLLPLCGRTLLGTVLDAVAELGPDRTLVVLHHHKDKVEQTIADRAGVTVVDQGVPRGTGHAVQVAMRALGAFTGDVVVVYGDCPLITADTLRALRAARGRAASLLTAQLADPSGLGRVLRDEGGAFVGIREERDCTPEEREIDEINAGFYCFDAAALSPALDGLRSDNAQGELYLTDAVGALVAASAGVETVEVEDVDEVQGVNSLRELAIARSIMQERILLEHLGNGVLIEDPSTTYIDHGVRIGKDTRVLPCTVIRAGVSIGEQCEVGPFAHLRAGTRLADGAEIGNFVEVKKSTVGRGTKAKHLTYLGDAEIGAGANIGCGTITANYDGKHKHPTTIEDGAFIGSGTVLVAPARVGKRAMTGAGAIVKRGTHVPDGAVFVGVPARELVRKPRAGD
jgi:bifunctional UDP-N-acetylglucosamine pyrophosphorylase/glucosamine-1-phosphate N-acetyltransferase